jgi:hypothetical protein
MAETSGNYRKGRVKPGGATVSCDQFWGLDPNDPLNLATGSVWRPAPACSIQVTPPKTHHDTISYMAKIFGLDMIQPRDKSYGGGESNFNRMGY